MVPENFRNVYDFQKCIRKIPRHKSTDVWEAMLRMPKRAVFGAGGVLECAGGYRKGYRHQRGICNTLEENNFELIPCDV